MMNDQSSECSCVIDCDGLHEIAQTKSGNLKAFYLAKLESGVIGVPTCVWNEFEQVFEDEASSLAAYVGTKISMKKAYHVGAASIADRLDAGFPRGAYDTYTDLYTASIATIEEYRVLTVASQLSEYEKMGCDVIELAKWADETS